MIGTRFGRLVVVSKAESKGYQRRWNCDCDCGKKTTGFGFSLTSGRSKSCGCIAAEKAVARWKRATDEMRKAQSDKAKTHGLSKHPMYGSWSDMRQRCNNSKHKWFTSYGGRGIAVCAEWNTSFEAFLADLQLTWFPKAQLGRKDNDGPYSQSNCQWESPKQQQRNKSNTPYVMTDKGLEPACNAAELHNISTSCLVYRMRAGWPQDKLFIPSQRTRS